MRVMVVRATKAATRKKKGGDGIDASGIVLEADQPEILGSIHDEPIWRLNVIDLLLGVGQLPLGLIELLVGLGGRNIVVGHALFVRGAARFQVGFGLLVLGTALLKASRALFHIQLALVELLLGRGRLLVGGRALGRKLGLGLVQGRSCCGDIGDALLQLRLLGLKLGPLLVGKLGRGQGRLHLGHRRLQSRQGRVRLGQVRLVGLHRRLGLGELRLGIGPALREGLSTLGVALLAVADLLLAGRQGARRGIQLALAVIQLGLGRVQLGTGIPQLGLGPGLLLLELGPGLVQIGLGLGLKPGHAGLLPLGGDGLDGGHHGGHAIVVGDAVRWQVGGAGHGKIGLHEGQVGIEILGHHVHELLDGTGADG